MTDSMNGSGEVLLAKYGEIALKGLNKNVFEASLQKTVTRRVASCGDFRIRKAQSTFYVEPKDDACDVPAALGRLKKVFGFSALNRAFVTEKSLDAVCETVLLHFSNELKDAKTFKISGKRSDKSFPLTSMDVAREVGAFVLSRFPHLRVAMDSPEVHIVVEIRDFAAYVHGGKIEAAGGMPTGTSGRAAFMLSGGIDSPVAAYMMARRGLELVGVHFMSPPYTSERAYEKVVRLARRVAEYTGNLPLFAIPFADIQLEIGKRCPEELFTVLMRRSMVRITDLIAEKEGCGAMITGESLAQVASQTLPAIACTDDAAKRPILRPLIGMDKTEIIEVARRIDTYDISILPYEDCCTVFTPKHPKTKPKLESILEAETKFDYDALEREAAENARFRMLHFFDKEED